jgi:hypothetical protein
MMRNPTVKKVLELFDSSRASRRTFENHWQDVADFVLPTREFTTDRQAGAQVRGRIYDDTGPNAATRLASAIDGLMTNQAMRWFFLRFTDIESPDDLDRDSQMWLREATRRMYDIFNAPDSGWNVGKYEEYQDLVGFGNGVMTVMESERTPVRFRARPLGETYVCRDDEGHLYSVFRSFRMKARDIAERWQAGDRRGVHGPSKEVLRAAGKSDKANDEYRVVHAVFRRSERDPQKFDATNKPWASFYIEHQTEHLLSEGGFDENPYVIPRWSAAAGEEYGRGPGMESLPSIRTLNAMQRTQIIAGELAVNPPVSVPANSVEGPIRTAPGAIIYRRAGTPNDIITPITTGVRPDIGEGLIMARQQMVARNFFLDMLNLPTAGDAGSEGHPRMSATEAMIRVREKQQTMAPVLSRLEGEFLGPVIRRVYRIMLRRGMLPPPPPGVRGRRLEIEYVSPLATSQRASEVTDILQGVEAITPFVQADPSAFQAINVDATVRHIFGLLNISPKVLRTEDQVRSIRQQIDQTQQAAAQAQIARDAGAAIKDTAAGVSQVREGVAV